MSGIYIHGMEMPPRGEYKPIFIYDTGEVTMEICDVEVQIATAIPVPDHGRLVDADALGIAEHEERFVKRADRSDWMDEYIVGIVDGLHEAGRRIINAPTVIPADRSDE